MRHLPIPNYIPIGGIKWSVEIVKELKDDEGNECHGLTDVDKYTIKLDESLSPEGRWQSLLHEAMHAAWFMGGHTQMLKEEQEEALIRCTESLLWGWLRTTVGVRR